MPNILLIVLRFRLTTTSRDKCVSERRVARGPTYLSVGHADEALVDQLVRPGVPGLAFHDVTLRRLVSQ